jgi:hypothetical protein
MKLVLDKIDERIISRLEPNKSISQTSRSLSFKHVRLFRRIFVASLDRDGISADMFYSGWIWCTSR